MPLTMKIQPIDSTTPECFESVKTVPKSRLRRLFDFSSFLRGSAVADRSVAGDSQCGKDCSDEFEPSSVCLDKMVQNFIEESNEKQSVAGTIKCGRHNHHQCNCVNGNNFCSSDGSEDEFDSFNCFGNSNNHSSSTDACDLLKVIIYFPLTLSHCTSNDYNRNKFVCFWSLKNVYCALNLYRVW